MPDLDRIKLEVCRGTRRHMIEIRRPYGANKIGLGKMAQKAITDVRPGFPHDIGKIGAPVIGDRKTLPDIKAVFFGRILSGEALLAVEPALDAAAYAIERQLGELFFKSGVVGEEYLTLPFPDAHLRRRNAGTG